MDLLATNSLKKHFCLAALSLLLTLLFSGCQIGYLIQSATGEISILWHRVDAKDALKNPKISDEDKRKIALAQEARAFAETEMKLVASKSYSAYVALDRPYVSYVVSAAPKWQLKHYTWSFPFVGEVPYKGFFNEQDAKEETQALQAQGLDTYQRGVSAFSTLGWFNDPLLSSMLQYSDHDLVNTIIHETTHATLYIKSSSDFNERLAVFVGNLGTEKFYRAREGEDSPTVKRIHQENEDEKLFSEFISHEIENLDHWYQTNPPQIEADRTQKFKALQEKFKTEIQPKMQTDLYARLPEVQLNNARLLLYKTYVSDLSLFQRLYEASNKDMTVFLNHCKDLEKHPQPEQGLKDLLNALTTKK